jgi:NAD+ diphosphatase
VLLGWFQDRRCVLIESPHAADDDALFALTPATRFEELRPLTLVLDEQEAALLAYARALGYWRVRHRYCGNCGSPARAVRAGHVMRCMNADCAQESFPRIDPAIIVLVTDGERALLGRQASWPPGRYSTIAGFVEPGESLEDAVAREVYEETGVRVLSSAYHSSQPWPFPSSLMLGFQAFAEAGSIVCNDAELEDARWFTRAQIASGVPKLPPPTSISYRLIQDWFDSGSERSLASHPDVGRWDGRAPR